MLNSMGPKCTRRHFFGLAGATVAVLPMAAQASPAKAFSLRAAPGRARLGASDAVDADVWAYNGSTPGPEIRVRQGERLRVAVKNFLSGETTVHWHGVRTPNAMDGVPDLTQAPIAPGEAFFYEFEAKDAGTFWYHPHQRSFEQVGRGLYGPLIVEEPEPPRVDREVVWMLDDWRLTRDGRISEDFGARHDMSHNGRVGNVVTINGRRDRTFAVRANERIRLRLINAANARIFGLDFKGHAPMIVALDGQPVPPHSPKDDMVVLGPAMRADVILDMTDKPGARHRVMDRFYAGLEYELIELTYGDAPLRERAPDWPIPQLASNPLREPALDRAIRHEIVFNGGMMGGDFMARLGGRMAGRTGSMMGMMHANDIWFLNGVAATGHVMEPMLALARDRSHVITLKNATAWHHPMHLHGHSFRVLSRNSASTEHREWQDTVLMAPGETAEIAFVADNPGDWMFHCHILEHQASGMMGVIRVV